LLGFKEQTKQAAQYIRVLKPEFLDSLSLANWRKRIPGGAPKLGQYPITFKGRSGIWRIAAQNLDSISWTLLN
jgi:hypothetical protein